MMLARDVGGVLADLAAIRSGATQFVTNLFAAPAQLHGWAASGTLERLDAPGCLFLLRRDEDFSHLYFAAAAPDALQDALGAVVVRRSEPVSCDVIGRPADTDRTCASLSPAGFVRRTLLARMVRQGLAGETLIEADGSGGVTYSAPGEATEVRSFLDRLLDRYSEQIPTVEEIGTMAERGGVLVYRVGSAIAGALLFDVHGLSAHLRYWWIDPMKRNRGIGSRLMRVFLHECREARRIVLWVVTDNNDSVTKYEHYGFRRDGLVDQIMFRPGSGSQ